MLKFRADWRIIKMQRYYRSRADLGKRAGIRGSSATRFASLPIYSRDLLRKFWRAILFLRQEVQIAQKARYIDATTKSLT